MTSDEDDTTCMQVLNDGGDVIALVCVILNKAMNSADITFTNYVETSHIEHPRETKKMRSIVELQNCLLKVWIDADQTTKLMNFVNGRLKVISKQLNKDGG